jgi:L,D-transpeptidase ErfK/SrfK
MTPSAPAVVFRRRLQLPSLPLLAAVPLVGGLLAAPSLAEPSATLSATAPAATPAPAAAPADPPRQLVLDRGRRVLLVLEGERELRRYPVAVGMPGWETPVGQFAVIQKEADPVWKHPANGTLVPPGPTNPLGSRWIGFHQDCRGRSGFNGQEHLVVRGCVTAGFHGTPNRGSIGQAVSHGCVRLFDEHARELFDLVSLGTPVTVLP